MNIKSRVEKITLENDILLIDGYAFLDENLECEVKRELIILNVHKNIEFKYELVRELRTDIEFLHKEFNYQCRMCGFSTIKVDLNNLYLHEGDWKFSFRLSFDKDKKIEEDLIIPLSELRNLLKTSIKYKNKKNVLITPRYKENKFLNLNICHLEKKQLYKAKIKILRKKISTIKRIFKEGKYKVIFILFVYSLIGKYIRGKKLWIMGERRDTAQDNTYHLFEYVVKNNDANAFYIIDKKSNDYKKVSKYKNIINYGTVKHTLYLLCSNITISSYVEKNNMHTEEYKYILKYFPEIRRNKKVFLQHGVIGVSRVNHSLHKNKVNYDLFIVSSDFEREHIIKEYGYSNCEVKATGLARWDKLEKEEEKKKILLMPTWRKWIKSEDDLLDSKYFKTLLSLLKNEKLKEFLENNNIELTFYPHYQIQKVIGDFKIENSMIKLAKKDDISVQELIKSHSMLITDYSTVSFDFAYLLKPVLFYQFDYGEFYGNHYNEGPINHKNDLFGEVIEEENELIRKIIECIKQEKMEETYIEKSNKFIKYRDKENSKRILEAINLLN